MTNPILSGGAHFPLKAAQLKNLRHLLLYPRNPVSGLVAWACGEDSGRPSS
jgi:hypothetical protein